MRLRCCLIIFWFWGSVSCLAQNPSLNSLKEQLKRHPAKDSILIELAQVNKQIGTYLQAIQPSEAISYFGFESIRSFGYFCSYLRP